MKHLYYIVIIVIMVMFSLFSCSNNTTNEAANNATTSNIRRHPVAATAVENQNEGNSNENFYVYESKNRRDPFKPVLKLESKVDINKIKLVGFFEDNKNKVIKAIVESETGNSYYLSEGDFLGNAKVVSVDMKNKKVIFETQKDYYTEQKVLKMED